MKIKFGGSILLYITILFNHIQVSVCATSLTYSITPTLPTPKLPSIKNGTHGTVGMATHTSNGIIINQFTDIIRVRYKIIVTPTSVVHVTTSYFKTTILLPKSSTTVPKPSSIWSTSSNNPKLPSTPQPTLKTPSPSPTHKVSPKTTKSSALVHKVGLIVGVVLGMVILSVCLIVFHKKETRIKCLKLMCRPCTKNYSSRYNIVPIYVYDDNEQDIRELQDDSDLPLV